MFIEDDEKVIKLEEPSDIKYDSFIYVKTVSIFWNYNVYSGHNEKIIHGSTTVKFEPGYWTFE